MPNVEPELMEELKRPFALGTWSFIRHSSLEIRHSPQMGHPQSAVGRGKWWTWSWAAILLLAGYLLFAHGCHPDEDTELFARVVASRER